MKLGAEPKKVAVLVVLLAAAAYLFLSNSGTAPAPPSAPATAPAQGEPVVAAAPSSAPEARVSSSVRRSGQPFRPVLRPADPEDRPDPATVDPSLKLDVLARLQELEVDGVERSLFDFSAPPAPERPEPKIVPQPVVKPTPEPPKPVERPKPAPPPIPLRFYGYISDVSSTDRRAFFIDGEDIFVAGEGDLIDNRYKVVHIGVNSAEVEDTEHDNQQTIALVPEMR